MAYPTLEEVNNASHYQICSWWRFLGSPAAHAVDKPQDEFQKILDAEVIIMTRIGERLKEFGGFTPEISKSLGWER